MSTRRASLLADAAGLSPVEMVVLTMIRAHAGRPCPTKREIMEWTLIPRRRIWADLAAMQARGLIEIETQHDPRRRRMRVAGETWTDWTWRGDGNPGIRELASRRQVATKCEG